MTTTSAGVPTETVSTRSVRLLGTVKTGSPAIRAAFITSGVVEPSTGLCLSGLVVDGGRQPSPGLSLRTRPPASVAVANKLIAALIVSVDGDLANPGLSETTTRENSNPTTWRHLMARRGRAWKMDRTVVHHNGETTSNRYTAGDGPKPAAHTRKQYWHPGNGRFQRNPYYRPGA